MAKTTTATEAPTAADTAAVYVVVHGEIPRRDPKDRKKKLKPLGVGDDFTPADAEEEEYLLSLGVIMLKDAFIASGAAGAGVAIDAANARAEAEKDRADKLQAELDKLKAAAPAQT